MRTLSRCLLALALLAGGGCHPSPPGTVLVTGACTYRGAGVEGAVVRAIAPGSGEPVRAVSGHHGAFVSRLPPGAWRLEGVAVSRRERETRATGWMEVQVRDGTSRLDRVVLALD